VAKLGTEVAMAASGATLEEAGLACIGWDCPRDLKFFAEVFWGVVEPGRDLIWGKHLSAIAEHLEAVRRRQIKRLLITVPPRTTKSSLVSVLWPAQVWTTDPSHQFLCVSHSDGLATRDTRKMRSIVESDLYQSYWGRATRLSHDQNQKTRFENVSRGQRVSFGISASFTGEGGDTIILDDLLDRDRAMSEAHRIAAIEALDEKISTRLNDPATGAIVMIAQRLHESDPPGHAIKQGGWEHLNLPMRFEPDHPFLSTTSLHFVDWRTQDGELLWPKRFPENVVKQMERTLGPYGSAGQLQQRPAPRGGGMFKRDWFQPVARQNAPPISDYDELCRFWDLGGTEDGGDPTAGVLIGRRGAKYFIHGCQQGQWSANDRDTRIVQTASHDNALFGPKVMTGVEQEPGAAGKQVAENLVHRLTGSGYRAFKEPAQGDKPTRAESFQAACERGDVYVIEGDWLEPFLAELELFPYGQHDDRVDAVSGAFRYVSRDHGHPLDPHAVVAAAGMTYEEARKFDTFRASVGAVYRDYRTQEIGFALVGVNPDVREYTLLDSAQYDRADEAAAKDISARAKARRVLGIGYPEADGHSFASLLKKAWAESEARPDPKFAGPLTVYPKELSPKVRTIIGGHVVTAFRDGKLQLFEDDELLRQIIRLPIARKPAGFSLEDPEEHQTNLARAYALALAMFWAPYNMAQYLREKN